MPEAAQGVWDLRGHWASPGRHQALARASRGIWGSAPANPQNQVNSTTRCGKIRLRLAETQGRAEALTPPNRAPTPGAGCTQPSPQPSPPGARGAPPTARRRLRRRRGGRCGGGWRAASSALPGDVLQPCPRRMASQGRGSGSRGPAEPVGFRRLGVGPGQEGPRAPRPALYCTGRIFHARSPLRVLVAKTLH